MRSEPIDHAEHAERAAGRAAQALPANGSGPASEPAASFVDDGEERAPVARRTPRRRKAFNTRTALYAIAAVAGLAELAYAVVNVSAMPVYLRYSEHYGAGAVTTICAAFLLFEGLAKGPFGLLGDKIGRKVLIVGGPLVSVFTSLLTLLVPRHQWYTFVFLRSLDGLGAAALWPSAMAMITDVVPEEHRSRALSLFNVTYMIGIALGPFMGGVANDVTGAWTRHVVPFLAHHGPAVLKHLHHAHAVTRQPGVYYSVDPRTASFYLASFLFLVTGLVAWWTVPDVPPHHEHHPGGEGESLSLGALWTTLRSMPAMMMMAFVTFFGIGLLMYIIKFFAMDELGMNETQFGLYLLVPALIIAAVSVPLGSLGDKIGRVHAVRIGIGLCAASIWILIFLHRPWALVVGGTLIGIGFVMAFPAWMAYLSTLCDPRQRGSVMGAFGTAQGVGALLGAPAGGYLYQHAHVHVPGLPWLNAHYMPFVGCATLLIVAWLIAAGSIHDRTSREAAAPA